MYQEEPATHYDHYRVAKSHEKHGRFEEALESYAKAIQLDEDYAYAWYYKGLLHQKMGQKKEAVRCAERALAIEPGWEKHVQKIIDECSEK
ncbi:MAG: tetratricopeptide repeat protein [Candidatus Lokiarchaeota archaeon]|nr:tetratricopeptide repeat protein [Candidatus Lokiarchaeota archaeon]